MTDLNQDKKTRITDLNQEKAGITDNPEQKTDIPVSIQKKSRNYWLKQEKARKKKIEKNKND